MQQLQRQENVGLMIGVARRSIKQAASELARPFHLSAQRFWLLLGISEQEGLCLGELAAWHHVDEPTASRIVAGLVRRGLVCMAEDPEDRRRSRLTLTRPGSELAGKLRPLAEAFRAATVSGLSTAEQRTLGALLGRVAENVDRFTRERRDAARLGPARGDR